MIENHRNFTIALNGLVPMKVEIVVWRMLQNKIICSKGISVSTYLCRCGGFGAKLELGAIRIVLYCELAPLMFEFAVHIML